MIKIALFLIVVGVMGFILFYPTQPCIETVGDFNGDVPIIHGEQKAKSLLEKIIDGSTSQRFEKDYPIPIC